MSEDPLVTSIITLTSSTILRRFDNGDPLESLARVWPCARCGAVLALIHLLSSLSLLFFDILTNHLSHSIFAIPAALSFFVCSVLCLIIVRRLDRTAQIILSIGCILSSILCICLFLENAHILNTLCSTTQCLQTSHVLYSFHVSLSLVEFVTCVISLIVCYRSLRRAYGIASASSPYSTLIIGDYSTLRMNPKIKNPRFIPKSNEICQIKK